MRSRHSVVPDAVVQVAIIVTTMLCVLPSSQALEIKQSQPVHLIAERARKFYDEIEDGYSEEYGDGSSFKSETNSVSDTRDGNFISSIDIEETPTNLTATNLTATNVTYLSSNYVAEPLNIRPIIGILSQEPGRKMRRALLQANLSFTSYIAASYVKSVEGAGARVVPILINQPPEYYRKLAGSLNGILFPGGAVKINNQSGYGRAGDSLYQMVLEANNNDIRTPLWATCLGFEMLVYLAADRTNLLSRCRAQDRADPLHMQAGFESSKLWRTASSKLLNAVQTEYITSNFHKYCITPEAFFNNCISKDYNVLSTNLDDNGIEYVSTIEHKRYPIFGTQWHPEKAPYEWIKKSVPHTATAVNLEHHCMEVFVEAARRNHNSFSNEKEEEKYLIYNYSPIYIATYYKSSFQQCYFF